MGLASGTERQNQYFAGNNRTIDPTRAQAVEAEQRRVRVSGSINVMGRGDNGVAKAKDSVAGESAADALGYSAPEQVTIKPWSPDTPYLKALRAAGPNGAYDAYLRERKSGGYENSPAFYLDCAEFLIAQGQNAMGVRVLTSILDLKLEEPSLVRITAHRLVQLGYRDAGIRLFAEAKRLRPEEPQSYRDLALAYADRADDEAATGRFAAAASDDNQALSLLNEVVVRPWDGRFPEVETIVLMEANRIAARAKANPHIAALVTDPIDSRLTQNLPCDLRILLTWNTDETDQDLWVIEPTGEKCFYAFNRTRIGGRLSHDFTQGYGPEEYLLKKSIPGKYKIQTNYYGQHSPALDGGTTVQATVITNWGRPTEKRQYLTVRVNQAKDVVDIGSVVR